MTICATIKTAETKASKIRSTFMGPTDLWVENGESPYTRAGWNASRTDVKSDHRTPDRLQAPGLLEDSRSAGFRHRGAGPAQPSGISRAWFCQTTAGEWRANESGRTWDRWWSGSPRLPPALVDSRGR